MGPTNVALVKLFQADQKLREAQGRLEATTKNVRVQERRVKDLTDRIHATSARIKPQPEAHSWQREQAASARLRADAFRRVPTGLPDPLSR